MGQQWYSDHSSETHLGNYTSNGYWAQATVGPEPPLSTLNGGINHSATGLGEGPGILKEGWAVWEAETRHLGELQQGRLYSNLEEISTYLHYWDVALVNTSECEAWVKNYSTLLV